MAILLKNTPDDIRHAANLLQQGKLVAIPTETVYGLAAKATDEVALKKIYQAKNRPYLNPLIIHYNNIECLQKDVEWTPQAQKLAQAFWPGPLTLVLKRSLNCQIPLIASSGIPTLAVRIPKHPLLSHLFTEISFPFAAPSANSSGRLSPTSASHVEKDLGPFITAILDGGPCQLGLESTVLDMRKPPLIRLLRPGSLSITRINNLLGRPILLPSQEPLTQEDSPTHALSSPGLSFAHYAPRQPVRLNADCIHPNESLLAFGSTPPLGGILTRNLSPQGDLIEAASNLFRYLHELEASSCKTIAVMPIPEKGLGIAINDRLRRAAFSFRQ